LGNVWNPEQYCPKTVFESHPKNEPTGFHFYNTGIEL
jgi:hypothetical protein